MNKFCPYCGAPYADDSAFCTKCGKKRPEAKSDSPQPVAPAPKKPDAPKKPFNLETVGGYFRKYLKIVLAVVLVYGLIVTIMNLFGTYSVRVTAAAMGMSESRSFSLKEIREVGAMPVGYNIALYLLGLGALAATGLGGYSMYLLYKDQEGSRKFFSLSILVGLAVGVVALLMMLIFKKATVSEGWVEMSVKIGTHFTTWFYVIIYALLMAGDRLLLGQNAKPLK